MHEIGKIEDNPDTKGSAFLIHPKIKDCVADFKTYSNSVIKMKAGKDSVTVINAYAQTSSAEDEEVEQFYNDIERAMADSDSKYKIITGDFNAKIATKTKEGDFESMQAFGIDEINERGDRLIEFAEEHTLIIANILFQKPKNRYWTWESSNRETRNQIDFTLSNQRGIVTNSEVITKVDIGSDHRLVRVTLRINKRLASLTSIKKHTLLILTHKTQRHERNI